MRKRALDNTLSAIVLMVYAIVWIVSFIFYQMDYTASTTYINVIEVIKSIMQVFVYIVLFYNAWRASDGFFYRTLIVLVTLWLIFCVVAGYIPELNIPALN